MADDGAAEAKRADRLAFRVDARTRDLIERAASLEGRRLTDYCLEALAAAARKTVAEHEVWVLNAQERELFFDALMNPPEPNAALRQAFARADALIRK